MNGRPIMAMLYGLLMGRFPQRYYDFDWQRGNRLVAMERVTNQ